jgi:O-antigen ligase
LALEKGKDVGRWLDGVAAAGAVTALLIIAEAAGAPGASEVTAWFRSQAFQVGGEARPAATFGYPNIAAGFLVLALPAGLWRAMAGRARTFAFLYFLLLVGAIVLTLSRAALLAAAVTPLLFWFWGRRRGGRARRLALGMAASGLALLLAVALASSSFRLRARSEDGVPWYRAEFHSRDRHLQLAPGGVAWVPVTVRNGGLNAWPAAGDGSFKLSYHWYPVDGAPHPQVAPEATVFPQDVAPGDSVELLSKVKAPGEEGDYLLVWDLIRQKTDWWVGRGAGTRWVSVSVGEGSSGRSSLDVAEQIDRDSWFPGRLTLWSVALGLVLKNPWLGVGPDNFRWSYGPAALRARWDTRLNAHSLYLETLANTGLLGAFAFFGLLAAACRALVRVARGESAGAGDVSPAMATTVLAVLGGFLIHGFLDSLVGFTAIYLLLWVMLGAGAALVASERRDQRASEPLRHACWV